MVRHALLLLLHPSMDYRIWRWTSMGVTISGVGAGRSISCVECRMHLRGSLNFCLYALLNASVLPKRTSSASAWWQWLIRVRRWHQGSVGWRNSFPNTFMCWKHTAHYYILSRSFALSGRVVISSQAVRWHYPVLLLHCS